MHSLPTQPTEAPPFPCLTLPLSAQEELEHLNQASEEINQVELQLDVSILPRVSPCVPYSAQWQGKGRHRKQEGLRPTIIHLPTYLSLCQEARTTYRRILQESARKLNTQGSHLGSCIEKARPYYEARRQAKEVQPPNLPSGRAMHGSWPRILPLCMVGDRSPFLFSSCWFMPLFFAYPPLFYPSSSLFFM